MSLAKPRSVRVPDELWDAYLDAAAVRGVTVTDVILAAMRAYLARAPDPAVPART